MELLHILINLINNKIENKNKISELLLFKNQFNQTIYHYAQKKIVIIV